MVKIIRQKSLFGITIEDIKFTTLCRVNLKTGHVGVIVNKVPIDKSAEHSHNSYARNIEKGRERSKKYREKHPEFMRAHNYQYRSSHPLIRFGDNQVPRANLSKAPKGYVWHHTCYDHADPEANCVLLSIRTHLMGHQLLKTLGIEIPHINKEK